MTEAVTSDLELIEELGGGYFGTVHAARMKPHGDVAAKQILCEDARSLLGTSDWNELVAHLFREAESLKKAEHANVVRVYSVHHDEPNDCVFIITERCTASLDALCDVGPLPLSDVKTYIRDALAGLEALHLRGMLHRDIKPGNILLSCGQAKLADFGFVTDNILKGYASNAGYPDHLAPEVFEAELTSTKTDVWAMGMTLYRLLNGEPWYREHQLQWGVDWRNDPQEAKRVIEERVTSGTFAERLRWMPHVPKRWRRVVNRALAHRISRRFQTAGEMLTAITPLPSEPSWTCVFDGEKIVWERRRDDREELVEWTRASPRSAAAIAYSRPAEGAAGRKLTLMSSIGSTSKTHADLQRFFGTRTR